MSESRPMAPATAPSGAARLVPPALLLSIGTLWGFFFVLIKTGVTGGVGPTNYVFWFTLIAGLVVTLLGRVRGSRLRFGRAHVAYYYKAGLVRFTLANILLYAVQGKVSVGIMAALMTFVPIFTYGFSVLFRIERLDWLRLFGIVVGFGGVLLIVLPKNSLPDPALALWVLAGLGAPMLHALGYVILSARNRPPDADSHCLAAGTLFAAATMALPIAIAAGQFHPILPPFSKGEIAMLCHAVLAGVNFIIIFELIRIAGPTYMSQANFLSVVTGVAFGILLFGERHSLYVWGAIGLVIAGLALVNARRGAG